MVLEHFLIIDGEESDDFLAREVIGVAYFRDSKTNHFEESLLG